MTRSELIQKKAQDEAALILLRVINYKKYPRDPLKSKKWMLNIEYLDLFLAVEINDEMIKFLEKEFPTLKIAPISAEKLDQYLLENGLSKATHIISGLPWAIFNEDLQEAILASIVKSMQPEGIFTTFAYVHALKLKPAKNFKEKLSSFFGNVEVTSPVWMNIPPAIVYNCRLR